ncbi:ABC transporter substrate-binding protein [Paenibacillus hodogayensis]|uniref:ABC transporter substrate-binding protein n=1 Tax=Paenibacillus hodogayensis TaxID=279208 RepID=A0ABV5W6V7_9BACL
MSNSRKRFHVLPVSAALLAALATGCTDTSKSNQPGNVSPSPSAGGSSEVTKKEAAYPAALSYWVAMNSDEKAVNKDYNDMAMYKELEKRTGTKVEFQHPAGTAADQFNLLLAGNKLPDVIYWNWRDIPRGPGAAIQDKTILRLNELIDSYAPNFKKYLQDNPEMKKAITLDDGTIYAMPFLTPDQEAASFLGPIIRKDWLDKAKLQSPTTIDEWYTALKAFKATDMNGNGKNDEIPLLLDQGYLEAWSSAWGVGTSFYLDNGKVKYGPTQPVFKEFLKTMNQWYAEKLIDNDYLVTDGKLRDSKVTSQQLGALVGYVGSGIGKYMDAMTPNDPNFELVGAPFPVLKAGDKNNFGMSNLPFIGSGAAITTASKNPEQIIKWLDYAYSREGSLLFNFGTEGVSYKMENGKPKFTDTILKNPDKLSISQALAKFAVSNGQGPFVYDSGVGSQVAARPQQAAAKKAWGLATGTGRLPGVTLTVEEGAKFDTIMGDVNTYYKEMINKFIMGIEKTDKFDEYVKKIQSMNIDEAVKIQQAALDRYNQRK